MKPFIKMFLLLFMFIVVSIEADYCIQVQSSPLSTKDRMIKEAKSQKYDSFSDVRVESREPYAVFRIGDYEDYKDARRIFSKIRHIESDAFIRKCDLDKDKIFYIRNETQTLEESFLDTQNINYQEEKPQEKPQEKIEEEPEEEITLGFDEKTITDNNNSNQTLYEESQVEDNNVTVQDDKTATSSDEETEDYTAFEALTHAYGANSEGNQTKAYHLFNESIDKCSEASIYNKACVGSILNAPLRRKNIDDPYYVTFYGSTIWYKRAYKPESTLQTNFDDTVYQFKVQAGRYMDKKKKFSVYLFAHLDGDVNSKAGAVPVIYSDNYAGIGIGADYRLSPHSRVFVEASYENNLIHDAGVTTTQFDYKGGIDYYNRWGPASHISCSYDPLVPLKWFSDLYAAAIFYSRYDNNIIMQSSARLGVELFTYKMSTVSIYMQAGITADSEGVYYNNIIETGPGIELQPYQLIPFSIRGEYRFAKFFKNVPDGETDRFNTFLIYGIFYFEQ